MKKKFLFSSILFLSLIFGIGVVNSSSFDSAKAKDDIPSIDYSSDKWEDTSDSLWSIDSENKEFIFNNESKDDKKFTRNVLLTNQFDNTRGAQVTVQATFQASTTSDEILNSENDEVHLGIIPWYKDSNNWVICYVKFGRSTDVAIKDGHIFELQVYTKIDGSTHVEYYCKEDGNVWMDKDDEANSEWHSTWPDRINANKNPTTLQDLELEPTDEITILAKKTRKTYAGKECDSFYVKVNDYELNFGMDNFMFTGLKLKEDEDESFTPKVGFYMYNTKKATVNNFSITVSHDEILPIPTIEPLDVPVTSGNINKKVKVPEFVAYNNNGEVISYTITLNDPDNESLFLDGEDYFIPTKAGNYEVIASATADGYTGTYTYIVKIKGGSSHIDTDVYNDIYTYTPFDTSIPVAYVILISVPIIILAYIGFKLYFYFKKRGKNK